MARDGRVEGAVTPDELKTVKAIVVAIEGWRHSLDKLTQKISAAALLLASDADEGEKALARHYLKDDQ